MVETVLVTSRLQPPGDETLPVDDFDIYDFNRSDDREELLGIFGE